MVSVYLPDWNLLFLHVPRTAGGSISRVLRNEPDAIVYAVEDMDDPVPCASQLQRRLSTSLSALNTFAVVRNPWDWMVSGYLHLTENAPTFDQPPTFTEFVRGAWRNANRNPYPAKFTSPATCVAYHTQISPWEHLAINGCLVVDHICRFETLEADVSAVFGRALDLPHVHKSKRSSYASYYDEATRLIVAKQNASLIAQFGYEFEAS